MAHRSPVRRRPQNPPMPPQPAADRPAISQETTPGGSWLQAWPRFQVYIDGRCPIEDTLNAIPYERQRNLSRWNLKRLV